MNARPVGVTLVGILIIIVGILGLIAGIGMLFVEEARVGVGLISLIITIIVALVYLAVAKGIFSGNNFSRLLVAIVTLVNLVIGVIHLIFVSGLRWNGLFEIIFALIILGLLYNRRASLFFATN